MNENQPSLTPIAPDQLTQAKAILDTLAKEWAFDHGMLGRPLWQDGLEKVCPEWGVVCGLAISWLDRAPYPLMSATNELSDNGVASGYAKVSEVLNEISDEIESIGKKPKYIGFGIQVPMFGRSEQISHLERLKYMSGLKRAVDDKSKGRIRNVRSAFDLIDTSQDLASILVDALPLIKQDLAARRPLKADGDSLFEGRLHEKRVKEFERAVDAIALVETRLDQEFSRTSTINRDSLEKMINEEEKLQDVLASMITRINTSLTSQSLNQVSVDQTQKLAQITPPSSTDIIAATSPPVVKETKSVGWRAMIGLSPSKSISRSSKKI